MTLRRMKHTPLHLVMDIILNKTDYIGTLGNIVKESIDKGTYTLTEDNTIKYQRTLSNFSNEIWKDIISFMICYQYLTNQPEHMLPLKHIDFHLLIA